MSSVLSPLSPATTRPPRLIRQLAVSTPTDTSDPKASARRSLIGSMPRETGNLMATVGTSPTMPPHRLDLVLMVIWPLATSGSSTPCGLFSVN